MAKCKTCGTEIRMKNLNKVFQFTLGNTINGIFQGNKTIYYHVDCLNGKDRSKKGLLAIIN